MARPQVLALAGLVAAACSGGGDPAPAPGTAPSLTVRFEGGTTGAPLSLAARASDPDAADTISCSWALAGEPAGSAVTLAPAAGDCRAAELVVVVAPQVPGRHTFRATVTDGTHTTSADVEVEVASAFGGGEVAGSSAELTAASAALRDRLLQIQSNAATRSAQAAAREFMDALAGRSAAFPYAVVDVRDPGAFAAGHLPGAVNVPLARLPDVLLGNPNFPEPRALARPARKVLVAGYHAQDSITGSLLVTAARCGLWGCSGETGTTGAIPAGQRSHALQHGMSAWTYDLAASPFRFDDDLGVHRLEAAGDAVSVEPWVAPPADRPFPALAAFTGAPDVTQQVLVRARAWLAWQEADAAAEGVSHARAFHTDFVRWDALRRDADAANDPQLVVFQSAAQWAAGHPAATPTSPVLRSTSTALGAGPAAGNVWQELDPSRPVYVACFSGLTEVPPAVMLGVLGYRAKAVLYGISGWTASAARGATLAGFDAGALGNDFPLARAGEAPCADPAAPACADAFGASEAARAGCEACHASYAAHFYDLALAPATAGAPEVASEGEG